MDERRKKKLFEKESEEEEVSNETGRWMMKEGGDEEGSIFFELAQSQDIPLTDHVVPTTIQKSKVCLSCPAAKRWSVYPKGGARGHQSPHRRWCINACRCAKIDILA
jgi:hypothetical protein